MPLRASPNNVHFSQRCDRNHVAEAARSCGGRVASLPLARWVAGTFRTSLYGLLNGSSVDSVEQRQSGGPGWDAIGLVVRGKRDLLAQILMGPTMELIP